MAGAKGFLIKPCTIEDALNALHAALRWGVAFGEAALPYLLEIIHRFRLFDLAWNLTPREEQILASVFEGKSYREISSALGIGEATVHTHLTRLFEKFGVHSKEQLIAKFLQI